MQFPTYPEVLGGEECIKRDGQIVEAMIMGLASREAPLRPDHMRHLPNLQSRDLGKACLVLAQHNHKDRYAHKQVIAALRSGKPFPPTHAPLIDILAFKNSPKYVEKAQQQLHAAAIVALREVVDWGSERSQGFGRVTEQVGTALLTRYAHPAVLAFPALEHHETDVATSLHYDLGVVIRDGDKADLHLLQLKTPCNGRCGEGSYQDWRPKYAADIQMVSGCCDLELAPNGKGVSNDIPRMLVREFEEMATAEDIKHLDVLTDALLFNITADLLPRGTAEPYQIGMTG